MTFYLLPVLYTVMLWWFTTGLVIVVYGRSVRTVRLFFVIATGVMLAALGGLVALRDVGEPWAVYATFTCGTLVWGWLMASYYLGFITGEPLPTDLRRRPGYYRLQQEPVRRLRLAVRASMHHELLVLAFGLGLFWLNWNAANPWGSWTFLALWVMHLSSKLNVFFGVRNFPIEYLPRHLHGFGVLLGKRPINPFFPFAVVAATLVVWRMFSSVPAPDMPADQAVGLMLVGWMILLGVMEHWLLVLPVPAMIWGWHLRLLPPENDTTGDPTRRPGGALSVAPGPVSES